ncbi:MAG: hypothetical protein ABSF25_20405 [Bryobacteraceae bacterium]|jgi:hypothetical protein
MKKRFFLTAPLAFCIAGALPVCCFGQSSAGGLGIAVGAGTLGAGIEAATAVTRKSNVRVGFNYFKYSDTFTKSSDNITFNGTLKLESAEVLFDQYIVGPIHISAGTMIYDGNQGTASASVPAGQSFTLNDVTYYSGSSAPVTGTGSIAARKVAPEVLIGFGNLLPRNTHHFTANFELGVAFQGSPNAMLNLAGSACAGGPGLNCSSIASTPAVLANVQAEQTKLNNSLAPFKYYPIVRLTFGYKF